MRDTAQDVLLLLLTQPSANTRDVTRSEDADVGAARAGVAGRGVGEVDGDDSRAAHMLEEALELCSALQPSRRAARLLGALEVGR